MVTKNNDDVVSKSTESITISTELMSRLLKVITDYNERLQNIDYKISKLLKHLGVV